MTEENYNYRTCPSFLRNQFDGDGKPEIPIIPKVTFTDEELSNLLLIGFDRTKLDDSKHLERIVHFFLYDYKFERVWGNPEKEIEKLKKYKAVLSPDFSMYREMNLIIQLYNMFRNRWCGAYLASKGIKVIPTVSWGDENTFDFDFLGIPKGSTVAVSTYMVSEHNNHKDQKEFFLNGYNEMLKQIEPERIICYNNPFAEMQGNIVFVDYELSSWKYQNEDYKPSKYLPYILGEKPIPVDSNLVIKQGQIIKDNALAKGMGSAHGGDWQPSPNKPEDERLLGKPGEIKQTTTTNKNGVTYTKETKIGNNGKTSIERHHSNHGSPEKHTNPHDHAIDWKGGSPHLGPQINYHGGAPELKEFKGVFLVKKEMIYINCTDQDLKFHTIADFKQCMLQGGEVEIGVGERRFGIFGAIVKTDASPVQKMICEVGIKDPVATEMWCDTADELLEYLIDGVRLREIITEVEVFDRTI